MRRFSLITVFTITVFSSCSISRLSKTDLAWQPYHLKDKLVFESSDGEIDSLKIKSIEKYNNPEDPLAIFPNRVQTLFVTAHKSVMKLTAAKSGSYIEFRRKVPQISLLDTIAWARRD